LKKFVRFSGGLGVLKISQNAALRLDIQMVIIILGTVSAGIYSVAARLGNFYPIAIASLVSVFASRLSAHSDRGSLKRISQKALIAVGLVVGGMLFCSLFAHQIISLLFGAGTDQAGTIYRYLSLSYIPLALASLPLSLIIYWFKKPGIAGKLGLVQLVLIISGHLLLIPRFHELGPVISLSIANTTLLFASIIVVRKLWTSA
jgi:O-antigen/teichoic acid export membrane protein